MFFGLSQSSTQTSQISTKPKTVVLAEETDDEDWPSVPNMSEKTKCYVLLDAVRDVA